MPVNFNVHFNNDIRLKKCAQQASHEIVCVHAGYRIHPQHRTLLNHTASSEMIVVLITSIDWGRLRWFILECTRTDTRYTELFQKSNAKIMIEKYNSVPFLKNTKLIDDLWLHFLF